MPKFSDIAATTPKATRCAFHEISRTVIWCICRSYENGQNLAGWKVEQYLQVFGHIDHWETTISQWQRGKSEISNR
jgi:hypothetical protein